MPVQSYGPPGFPRRRSGQPGPAFDGWDSRSGLGWRGPGWELIGRLSRKGGSYRSRT